MQRTGELLIEVLRQPQQLGSLSLHQWDVLLREARCLKLLARIATKVDELGIAQQTPERVRLQLQSEQILAQRHEKLMRWEVDRLQHALREIPGPVVLLKGAAYVMLDLPNARGRFTSDADLMVPEEQLPQVEQALYAHGWEAAEFSAHEARYYRRWLQEWPPFVHRKRRTTLDVHHNVLPRIDKLYSASAPLFASAVPLAAGSKFYTLAPVDQVLHVMIHLFRNGDFSSGLRDLTDLDDLLRHYGRDAAFWPALVARTCELRFQTPVYFALRYVRHYLHTPIANELRAAAEHWRPRWPSTTLMDALVDRALRPPALDGRNAGREAAQWMLIRYPLCLWKKTIRPKLERLAG